GQSHSLTHLSLAGQGIHILLFGEWDLDIVCYSFIFLGKIGILWNSAKWAPGMWSKHSAVVNLLTHIFHIIANFIPQIQGGPLSTLNFQYLKHRTMASNQIVILFMLKGIPLKMDTNIISIV
ncbi:hypothetical protein ACJX0J_030679, partial [Zea mays]